MNKNIIAAMLIIGMAARAAQGTTITDSRDINNAVAVPSAQPTVIASIVLPPGHWSVSGTVVFYEGAELGMVFVGASISEQVTVTLDGFTPIDCIYLPVRQNAFKSLPLSSRTVRDITVPTTFYLVANSWRPGGATPHCLAFGYIQAERP